MAWRQRGVDLMIAAIPIGFIGFSLVDGLTSNPSDFSGLAKNFSLYVCAWALPLLLTGFLGVFNGRLSVWMRLTSVATVFASCLLRWGGELAFVVGSPVAPWILALCGLFTATMIGAPQSGLRAFLTCAGMLFVWLGIGHMAWSWFGPSAWNPLERHPYWLWQILLITSAAGVIYTGRVHLTEVKGGEATGGNSTGTP